MHEKENSNTLQLSDTDAQFFDLMLGNPFHVVTSLTLAKTSPFSGYTRKKTISMIERVRKELKANSPQLDISLGTSYYPALGIGLTNHDQNKDKSELSNRIEASLDQEVINYALQNESLKWFSLNGFNVSFSEFKTNNRLKIYCAVIIDIKTGIADTLFLSKRDFEMFLKYAESGGYIDKEMATNTDDSVAKIHGEAKKRTGKDISFFKQIRPAGYTPDGSPQARNRYIKKLLERLVWENPSNFKQLTYNHRGILAGHQDSTEILVGEAQEILNFLGEQDSPYTITERLPFLMLIGKRLYPYNKDLAVIEISLKDMIIIKLFAERECLVLDLAPFPVPDRQLIRKRLVTLRDRMVETGYTIAPKTGIQEGSSIVFPIPIAA